MKIIRVLVVLLYFPSISMASSWIAEFNGPSAAYSIIRSGQKSKPELFQLLETGNTIEINMDRYYMIIAHADGSSTRLTQRNSPWTANKRGDTPSTVDNFLNWALASLKELKNSQYYPPVNMVTRQAASFDKPVKLIFPSEVSPLIMEGKRRFSIIYQGGKKLQKFKLSRGKKLIPVEFDYANYPGFRVATTRNPVDLVAGAYTLLIDSGNPMSIDITVLGSSAIPQLPVEMADEKVPVELEKLGFTTWLATVDNGKWASEAYYRLMQDDSHGTEYLKHILRHRFAKSI